MNEGGKHWTQHKARREGRAQNERGSDIITSYDLPTTGRALSDKERGGSVNLEEGDKDTEKSDEQPDDPFQRGAL